MNTSKPTLEGLWTEAGFTPNDNQKRAIQHIDGPLYLPAGPGSGKTRVLLWRTLNLIVFHGISPDEISLSTFTEKAARQLLEPNGGAAQTDFSLLQQEACLALAEFADASRILKHIAAIRSRLLLPAHWRRLRHVAEKVTDTEVKLNLPERQTPAGMKVIFAVQVCRNCDARFSCSTYRAYAQASRGAAESRFRHLFFDETLSDTERDNHVMAGLGSLIALEKNTK